MPRVAGREHFLDIDGMLTEHERLFPCHEVLLVLHAELEADDVLQLI